MVRKELTNSEVAVLDFWETEEIIIRDTIVEDIDSLQEIYIQSQSTEGWTRNEEFTNDYIHNAFSKGNLPPGGMKKYYKIQSMIHKKSSKIMGFLEVYLGYPQEDVVYIGTLLFCEDYRNKGYGQEVMTEFLKQIVELGFSKARLGVTLRNWSGIYFWNKLGFDKITKYVGDKVFTNDSFAILELERNLIV
ncbi:GNAT family N-acetyltransferase [Desulfosporosinus sp. FKB]|uniref:GNAT family N-acetyltransferase n=1 Tax=Desulfosporosinus sp. FKB TaxID=1969835 RepID=UPI000B49CC75|nr:GNAT family N-acetyltransferase [Desulfosporosinus sp. FKB]